MELKEIEIPSLDMSVRTTNALMKAGVCNAAQMADMSESELRGVRNMGEKSVAEALAMIEKLKKRRAEQPASQEETPDDRQIISDYLRESGVKIDVLDLLPPKAYNLLLFSGYEYLYQIVFMTEEEILAIQSMDRKSAAYIENICRYYLKDHSAEIQGAIDAKRAEKEPVYSTEETELSSEEKLLNLARADDIPIQSMMLSSRATRCLLRAGFVNRSDILFETPQSLGNIKSMGKTSIDEVIKIIGDYVAELKKRTPESEATEEAVQDADVRERVLNAYKDKRFVGFSFKEFKEKLQLPACVGDEQLKRVIGALIAEKELEYVDFRCYRVYPTLQEVIEKYNQLTDREKTVLANRLQGETLEDVGKMLGVTRERVRQIYKKALDKCQKAVGAKGLVLDEKYYLKLFKDYDFDKGIALNWLGFSMLTWQYLSMVCDKRDVKSLEEAVSDQELDVSLRLKIQNYLNRNKIFIDGIWIEKNRAALEDYVLAKFCRDEVTFEEFVSLYNSFLKQQNIPFDEKLYLTPEVARTRENKLDAARNVLCSFGHRIRYYDIDSRDYTELLDELVLPLYENTELSTLKFLDDYPEIMRRYDIRNQYELHNLLRKIVPEGGDNDLKFGSMPIIGFGAFDRTEQMKEILYNNSPLTWDEFLILIRAEYGYESGAIQNSGVLAYYHNGVFSIHFQEMSAKNMRALGGALTEDFYYLEEIKKIYAELFPQADTGEINSYNLKRMGFKVYSRYALQHHSSVEAYFKQLLTAQEVMDITPYRKRYGYIQMFSSALIDLKSEYTVLEYDVNRLIGIGRLEKFGYGREALHKFCDDVYDFVKEREFFTIQSLRLAGFESELDSMGLGDWFYANILVSDPRFSYCRACWTFVFCKGERNFTVQDFYTDLIEAEGWIDIFDMLSVLTDTYGFKIEMKSDITEKLKGSKVYHDTILGRLYASEELYQRSLDQEAG